MDLCILCYVRYVHCAEKTREDNDKATAAKEKPSSNNGVTVKEEPRAAKTPKTEKIDKDVDARSVQRRRFLFLLFCMRTLWTTFMLCTLVIQSYNRCFAVSICKGSGLGSCGHTVSLLIDCPRADMLFHYWLTALAQGEAGEEQQQGEARAQGAQPRDQAREGGRREANQRRASHLT